jgi:hypothetical protein
MKPNIALQSRPILLALSVLAVMSQSSAPGAVVVSAGHGTAAYAVSGTDLLQGPGTVCDTNLLNVNWPESWGGNTISNLTDGAFDVPGGNGLAIADGVLTYTLDTSTNVEGYNIISVKTYGGWPNWARSRQQYDLAYCTVADTNTFIDIAIAVDSGYYVSDAPSYTSVSITEDTAPFLATGVKAIRFTFPAQINGAAGYREIDVFGSASAGTNLVAPTIINQPQSLAGGVGANVQFSVTVDGSETLYYQWFKNQTNLMAGENYPALAFFGVTPADAALYSVLVSNSVGHVTSSNAVLRVVNIATNNTTSPYTVSSSDLLQGAGTTTDTSLLSVNSGESGSFTVGSLTDGLFPSDANAFAVSAGVLTYTLDTSANPEGYVITNIVTYGGWGNWGRSEQKYTVACSTVGTPTNFVDIAMVDSGYYIDDVPSYTRISITDDNHPVLATGVKAVRFTFPPQLNGGAGYREFDLLGSAILPTNSAAPQIVTEPADQNVGVGSTVQLFVVASGVPTPSYQWWKNETNLLSGRTGAVLQLTDVSAADAGYYSVVVSNSLGHLTSRKARLTVLALSFDGGTSPYAVLNTDLLQSPGVLADISTLQISPESGDYTVTNLTDGLFNTDTEVNRAFSVSGGALVYVLDTTLNRSGYTINTIATYGGWPNPGRDAQNYTVAYSTVAAPATFVDLATVSYNPPGSAPSYTRVGIADATGAPLASGAKMIRFSFGPQENGAAGYREFDVLGSAIPVPMITSLQKTSGGAEMQLSGVASRNYGVERAGMLAGPWARIATVNMGLAGTAPYLDAGAPATNTFYRMVFP